MHHLGSNNGNATGAQGAAAGAAYSNRNASQYSGAQGAAAGAAISNRNSPQYSGAQGAAAGAYAANRNTPQYSGAQGAAAGYAAASNQYSGFQSVAPSARYANAANVRTNFNHYDAYGADWYAGHADAWHPAAWTAASAWSPASWSALSGYLGQTAQPVAYNYGSNVTYQDNSVYVNGESAGTSEQYYDQAQTLADTGTQAAAPSDGDWMSLGVFALCKPGETKSDLTLQLGVNKDGVIRGNYTDEVSHRTQPVHGSVDKQTQRVAFTIGDNTKTVVETGLYNLTKDEAPCMLHFSADRNEQWLLVRLQQPADQGSPAQ
jgi:hypothetical protein